MWVVIVLVVAALAVVVVGVIGFNRLRSQDVRAQEALGGIDVQLSRRADLVPNLVETVKGYAAHEKGLFEEVTRARAQVQAATSSGGTVEARATADDALSASLLHLLAVAENYPDLKASTTFLSLQDQLAATEDKLAFARQYYNDAVATLNTTVVTIPWLWLAGMAGIRRREFYEAPEGQEDAPEVRF